MSEKSVAVECKVWLWVPEKNRLENENFKMLGITRPVFAWKNVHSSKRGGRIIGPREGVRAINKASSGEVKKF